jgi:hypothetical protein
MVEVTIAFITGVISPITLLLVKNWIEKKKNKKDPITETLLLGEQVTHKIDEIREGIKADRVWITQFHNGGHFYPTGKSIAKFSIIYETVDINVNSIQHSLQNVPVNLFSRALNRLVTNEIIEIYDFKDETVATFGLKDIAETNGCQSGYLFAIKTIDDKFIGVLGIDYTKGIVKLDDDVINNIMIQVSSLGGVLMNHLKG